MDALLTLLALALSSTSAAQDVRTVVPGSTRAQLASSMGQPPLPELRRQLRGGPTQAARASGHSLALGGGASSSPAGPAAWQSVQALGGPGVTLVDGGSGGHDYGYDLVGDGQGALYAVGSLAAANGHDDIVAIRFGAAGEVLWTRTYDGSAELDDQAFLAALDPAGNLLVAGSSQQTGRGLDITVLKYDPQGNLLWDFLYDGPGSGYDRPGESQGLALDSLGNVFVAGISFGGAASGYDGVLLKLASDSSLLWERRLDGAASGFDELYSLALDSADNLYVGGDTTSASLDFVLRKYNPAGDLLWQRLHDGPDAGFDLLYSLGVDAQANVFLTGLSENGASEQDLATLAYDSDGNLLWVRYLDGGAGHSDAPFSLATGPSGEVAVVGLSQDANRGSNGILVVYDASGNLSFQRQIGYGCSWFSDVGITSTGEVIACGFLDGFFPTSIDAMLLRYSPSGTLIEQSVFDDPVHAADSAYALFIDPADRVYAIGFSMGPTLNVDIALHRYQ